MDQPHLQLSGRVVVAPDPDSLFQQLGQKLMATAQGAVGRRGVFHLALSGGLTPRPFYESLATDSRYSGLPWPQTHLWMVDERLVPEDDNRSNMRMIRRSLVDHVSLVADHVHPVPVLADDPAAQYEKQLCDVWGQADTPRLDFILLGMGDDAHTASLFPASPALAVNDRWVVRTDGPHVTPPPRVTMTYRLVNVAREIAVLVTGAGKAVTLGRVDQQLRRGGADPHRLPITGVQPTDGHLTWYLDRAAAGS